MTRSVVDLTESSPPPIEQARTPSAKAVLQSAIETAQPARLRATLIALCNASTDTANLASRVLLVPENGSKKSRHHSMNNEESGDDGNEESNESSNDSEGEDENDSESAERTGADLKRLRTRYAMCENCSEEFDVTKNEEGACAYHDGRLIQTCLVDGPRDVAPRIS